MPPDASGINSPPARLAEIDRKAGRLAELAARERLAGVVLTMQHNFAWLTAGRSSRIDASRETGSASLLVTAGERRFVLANAIEAPRMMDETVAGLGFELLTYPWTDERARPALPLEAAAKAAGGPIGCDVPSADARPVEPPLSSLRCRLDPLEIPRYRELAVTSGRVVGELARSVERGVTEREIARLVAGALAACGIRATVVLIAADDRIARYRHPVPTAAAWRERLMIVVCAEREGQVVALSRIIATRADEELTRRTRAAADVYAALMRASVPGASGAELFNAAARTYAGAGFAGEEQRHHQGGVIGYRSREWVAHPASTDIVGIPQAFAWNPSITGTKVEDTCLVLDDGRIEVLTATPGWPVLEIEVRGQRLGLAGVMVRDT
jgi:Xaa-Pro aminopeptidase